MAPTLKDFSDEFGREADEIEGCFHQCASIPKVTSHRIPYVPATDGCATALWDAWGRFNRRALLASAAGAIAGSSGAIYTPSVIRTENQAIAKLRQDSQLPSSKIRLTGGEPGWMATEMLLDICQSLDLQSAHPIHGAITSYSISLPYGRSTGNPISEIRNIRNFCAHKSDKTYAKIRPHLRGTSDADAHMKQKVAGGIVRFSHWVDCLKLIAQAGTL